jgi:hypothetical protein
MVDYSFIIVDLEAIGECLTNQRNYFLAWGCHLVIHHTTIDLSSFKSRRFAMTNVFTQRHSLNGNTPEVAAIAPP